MMDSIEVLDEAIKEEQRSRLGKDVGFFDNYLSRTREIALRQELATAGQIYQGRQAEKALGRIKGGSWTTDDLLTAGTPFVFGAVGALTGAKGMGGKAAFMPTRSSVLPKGLKSYVRDVESKSSLKVHPKQQELLAKDLRENKYQKLTPEEKVKHSKPFQNRTFKDSLISEWEKQTGQRWPRYEADVYNPKTGILIARKGAEYQAHHINPQRLGGKHEWWNMHPVHIDQHQSGIHGSGSVLGKIIKGMNE